jgi:hypothetical protein
VTAKQKTESKIKGGSLQVRQISDGTRLSASCRRAPRAFLTRNTNKPISFAAPPYPDTARQPKDLREAICFHDPEALEFSPGSRRGRATTLSPSPLPPFPRRRTNRSPGRRLRREGTRCPSRADLRREDDCFRAVSPAVAIELWRSRVARSDWNIPARERVNNNLRLCGLYWTHIKRAVALGDWPVSLGD